MRHNHDPAALNAAAAEVPEGDEAGVHADDGDNGEHEGEQVDLLSRHPVVGHGFRVARGETDRTHESVGDGQTREQPQQYPAVH